jgi:hypothetical protein
MRWHGRLVQGGTSPDSAERYNGTADFATAPAPVRDRSQTGGVTISAPATEDAKRERSAVSYWNPETGPHRSSSWPGLETGGNGIEIDRDAVRRVIEVFRRDLESYSDGGDGSVQNLTEFGGNLTEKDLGNVPAATGLKNSINNANTLIAQRYRNLLESYQAVIDALNKAVGNVDEMEQANTAAANGARPGMGR